MYADASTRTERARQTSAALLDQLKAAGADPILNRSLTEALTGLSGSTLDRLRKDKKFPEPVELSARRVGWRLSTVQNWIASRSASTS